MKALATGIKLALFALLLVLASCGASNSNGNNGGDGGGSTTALTWNLTQFGTDGSDAGKAAAPDGTGGVFVGGESDKALDPSYTPQGGADIFLARYNANLQRLWVVQKGSGLGEDVWALIADPGGGVWIAGSTGGELYGTHQGVNGSADAYVAHYDANGNQLWTDEFGTNEDDVATSLAPGPEGGQGVYVGGYTRGDLANDGSEYGYYDAFLRFYPYDANNDGDPAGWTIELNGGSQVSDGIMALAPAPEGGVYAAGYTEGSLASGVANAGGPDAFVIRFKSDGTQAWARQFGTDGSDIIYAAVPAPNGGVYLAGTTYGTLASGEVGGWADAFIARYDADGNQIWIHQIGTIGTEEGKALTVTQDGTVFLAGTTDAELVEGRHLGSYNRDAFIAIYSPDGTLLALGQNAYEKNDGVRGLAPDGNGAFVVGTEEYENQAGGTSSNVLLGTVKRR